MRSALASLATTYQVGFDLDRDEVYVSYDRAAGDASTVSAAMVAAINAAGFKPWLKTDGWPETVDASVLPVRR